MSTKDADRRPATETMDLAEAVVLVTDRTPLPGFLGALVPATPPPPPIAVICAWCKSLLSEGTLPASHGICARCRDQVKNGGR